MPGQPIEIILLRELADHLSTAIFVVDPAGDLLYYNEPAEHLLGSRFDETGAMPLAEWSTVFKPTNGRGVTVPPDRLPLADRARRAAAGAGPAVDPRARRREAVHRDRRDPAQGTVG